MKINEKALKSTLPIVAEWILNSLKNVCAENIMRKSFKKCGISNSLDGTNDNIPWNTESWIIQKKAAMKLTYRSSSMLFVNCPVNLDTFLPQQGGIINAPVKS